jgi:hypothetical protein
MGARPSSFKKGGGGFLNGVDGVISGYQFTDEFAGEAFKPGKVNGKDKFHSLYCLLSVRVDGADEDVTTTLFVGGADDWTISEDGHTLEPVEDGRELGANTSFAKVITSLVESGFPETNLPEDSINYEAIIGTRARFVQKVNVEDTKKLGKRKDKKTGKEYDRMDLVIDQVYSLPGTQGAAATAPAAAPKAAAAGKKAAKAPKAVAEPVDVAALSTETLMGILGDSDGSIQKNKVSLKVIKVLNGHPQREAVRKWLFSDENLSSIDGVAFDTATGIISVA